MLGSRAVVEPAEEPLLDLLLRGVGVTTPKVLPHHLHAEAVQVERGAHAAGNESSLLVHTSILPAPTALPDGA